jgi:phage tail sheath gpL-like
MAPARGVVEITSYADLIVTSNDTLKIGATTFTFKATASLSTEVAAVTSNNQTASNLAAKINAHSTAGALFIAVAVGAVVTITAKTNTTEGSTIDLVYTDSHSEIGLTVDDVTFTGGGVAPDYVVIGDKVYFSDTTGKADDPDSLATVSDAVYVSGVMTGIDESGSEVAAALVDMVGGL